MAQLVESLPAEISASEIAAKPQAEAAPLPAVTFAGVRELAAIVGIVALADLTIYRGAGFAGLAALFAAGPALLLLGSQRPALKASFWIVAAMLLLLAMRLIWQGSVLGVVSGCILLVAYALALRGERPYVLSVLAGFAQLYFAGTVALVTSLQRVASSNLRLPRIPWLNYLLPIGALVMFGTLFIQANPDLAKSVAENIQRALDRLAAWFERFDQHWPEVGFWLLSGYVVVGLLRPLLPRFREVARAGSVPFAEEVRQPQPAPLYTALRNTLVAVIGLFAVYLIFEFQTLWFRGFPVGFYYAGYAHEGAAWLTAALALATLALSLIFRGQVLSDPRLPRLRLLAWIWSALNLVLALTVYHRMSIYIDFNGMTRMRTIGLFGISTVVAGFVLVIWKIVQNRDFAWLIQRQLWALAIAVYLYVLTPVDLLVQSYNVRQILRGDLAPSVQISVHPISAEGYLVLRPLVDCPDPIIRDGIRALLAEQELAAADREQQRRQLGWTTFQAADELLHAELSGNGNLWDEFRDSARREAALQAFNKYAYQWY